MLFITIVNEYAKIPELSWDMLSIINLSFGLLNLFFQWLVIIRNLYMIPHEGKDDAQRRKKVYLNQHRL